MKTPDDTFTFIHSKEIRKDKFRGEQTWEGLKKNRRVVNAMKRIKAKRNEQE
jgi:hypothetical protein